MGQYSCVSSNVPLLKFNDAVLIFTILKTLTFVFALLHDDNRDFTHFFSLLRLNYQSIISGNFENKASLVKHWQFSPFFLLNVKPGPN